MVFVSDPRVDQGAVRRRPRQHARRRAATSCWAADRAAVAAAARGRGAPGAAQADAAAVPRRADARLRGGDGARRPSARSTPGRSARRSRSTRDAGDHARRDPAGRLRRQGGAPRRAARRACSAILAAMQLAAAAIGLRCIPGVREAAGASGGSRVRSTDRRAPAAPRSRERRADPDLEEREDILSMLIAARYEDGEGMSDAELRDQLMTLLLAGHETTATALAWAFDLLFRRPEALARLREEVEAGEETEYLDAVIEEALRLRPVVPFVGRELRQPMSSTATSCRAGTTCSPSISSPTRAPTTFPTPTRSVPSASSRRRPRPTPGSRSAAAPAAASAPPSPSSRCGSCSGPMLRRVELQPASAEPEHDRPAQRHALAEQRHAGDRRAPPRAGAGRRLAAGPSGALSPSARWRPSPRSPCRRRGPGPAPRWCRSAP